MMSDNENEKRETVADIVAMVRRAAQYYDGKAEKSEGLLRETFKLSAANYRAIADLVEAAWKREKAEADANALAVGNAAATREACANIAEYARTARCHTDDAHVLGYLEQIEKWAESALSAPARNCDIYSDAREAFKAHEEAFNESNFHHGECKLGCPDCDDYAIRCEIKWLLAPAAELKGECDGR